jgi:peptide/nickel transport system ATP-binding protein
VFDRCHAERPDLLAAGATRAACWLYDETLVHGGAQGGALAHG